MQIWHEANLHVRIHPRSLTDARTASWTLNYPNLGGQRRRLRFNFAIDMDALNYDLPLSTNPSFGSFQLCISTELLNTRSMSEPSTKILDHIVHLTPPGTVELASQQFRDLGFNVTPGGTHTGGLTANALVILADGSYLELISFTHPASHYPPTSPDRQKRDSNPWSYKHPGWIDYAFLGSSDPDVSIARIINERADLDRSGAAYDPEVDGGRVREDGKTLKWMITAPHEERKRGTLPFFCGDVTPRKWRVPIDPPSNSKHPSGVLGISHVRILTMAESLDAQSSQLTSVVGDPPVEHSSSGYTWSLETPHSGLGVLRPRLILSAPVDEDEEAYLAGRGPGVYEVAFWVEPGGKEGTSATPYGKIVWQVKTT